MHLRRQSLNVTIYQVIINLFLTNDICVHHDVSLIPRPLHSPPHKVAWYSLFVYARHILYKNTVKTRCTYLPMEIACKNIIVAKNTWNGSLQNLSLGSRNQAFYQLRIVFLKVVRIPLKGRHSSFNIIWDLCSYTEIITVEIVPYYNHLYLTPWPYHHFYRD